MTEVGEQNLSRTPRCRIVGVVTSAHKTPQTLRVEIEYRVRHPKYGKYLKRTTVVHAHDPAIEAKLGDRVELMACRPISKTKCWRLVKVIGSAS